MKYGFKFSNLCGTVYTKGNIVFTSDGNTLLSPVGNKVTAYDLVNNVSTTLPLQHSGNIQAIALSPSNSHLISVDDMNNFIVTNFKKRIVLSTMTLKDTCTALSFSPNGKYFAMGVGSLLRIWKTPALFKEFAPLVLHLDVPKQHFDDITYIEWSPDSKVVVSCSKDTTMKVTSVNGKKGITLNGGQEPAVAAFFSADCKMLYTVNDRFLTVREWESNDPENPATPNDFENGRWQFVVKKPVKVENRAKVTSCNYHAASNLVVLGYGDGIFALFDLPEFNTIQTLSISKHSIDTVCINATGEWIALASCRLGQILVWEWQSETYVLKQQSHSLDMSCLAYSPDGQYIATGGDDGKVKVWNSTSGFCFVTFSEHSAPVTGIVFSPNNAVFTSSVDGTVRAFDLVRYRNFRTMTAPTPTTFSCVAVDPSGEIVCAGSQDSFEIFVWSVQTGKILDILSGHESVVSSIAFSPTQSVLVSGSWDKTVRVWDVFESKQTIEALSLPHEAVAVCFRPDGKEFCTATLDGQLMFWEPNTGTVLGIIEGRKDIEIGSKMLEPAKTNKPAAKYFTSISYSVDGSCIIAGGAMNYLHLYEVSQRILVRKYQGTQNRTFDGTMTWRTLRNTEAGPVDLIEEEQKGGYIPGAKKNTNSMKRTLHPEYRVRGISFSPTGRSWAAVTTEGLIVFSLDETLFFDPYDLDIECTPENIELTLKSKNYLKALVMSFQLNEKPIIKKVFDRIPHTEVQLIVQGFPLIYLQRLMAFLAVNVEVSPHIEFHMLWCVHIFNYHGRYLKQNASALLGVFRNLQKNITRQHQDLSNVCEDNRYTLDFLCTVASKETAKRQEAEVTNPFSEPHVEEMEVEQTTTKKSQKKNPKRKAPFASVQDD